MGTVDIWHLWCMFTLWKKAIPYTENAFLYRVSWLLTVISLNPRITAYNTGMLYVVFDVAVIMATTVVFLISFDTIGRTFRNSMDNQEKLNFVAMESLATSIKSGLVILFLLSQFFGGIGNHSTIGINSATLLLEGLQKDDPTYEAYSWEEEFAATKIVDGFLDSRKAIVAGLTLSIFLFFSFAFANVSFLSLVDIIAFRITLSEGVVLIAAVSTLVNIGVHSGESALSTTQDVGLDTLTAVASLGGVFFCGLIAHTISTGKHLYYSERLSRRETSGVVQAHIPLMTEDV